MRFQCGVILVVLLDTTKEATLEWTRYPYGPQAQTPGVSESIFFRRSFSTNTFFTPISRVWRGQWVEESFTNFGKGINWRSYVVCDVAYNNVNNWLWSPFIDRGPANRLYIEIQFTIRDCSLFPGNALSCKETFSLLFYEFDAATREPPPWQPESYKLIGNFLLQVKEVVYIGKRLLIPVFPFVYSSHCCQWGAFQSEFGRRYQYRSEKYCRDKERRVLCVPRSRRLH